MQHESSAQEYRGPCPKSLHLPDAPYTFESIIAPPSMPRWPSLINSQLETQQQIRPRTLPQDRKTVSATSSSSNLASRKVMTEEKRERMRAYAKDNPSATQQQIADVFGCGRTTVGRTLRSPEIFQKREQSMAAQLGRRRLALKGTEATPDTGSSCSPTNPPANQRWECDVGSVPHGELNVYSQSQSRTITNTAPSSSAPKTQSSRSLSFEHEAGATSSSSYSQRIPSCPSSIGSEDCQGPAIPTVPIIMVTTPNDSSLSDPHTDTSSTGDTSLFQPQRRAISPEEARKALGVVIGFCEHQPSGVLELEEGVHLGKLDERLRHNCG
ncbi:hypothetical protein Q7P37_009865 [Cladosporium fusiforme]